MLGDDIMRWAIHYFEEDSIEGKLYNEDGTEYIPPKPVKKAASAPPVSHTPPAPKPKPQLSMFDLLDGKETEQPKECASTDNVASTETPTSIPPYRNRIPNILRLFGSATFTRRLMTTRKLYPMN